MKKFLLLAVIALMVTSASAQLQRSVSLKNAIVPKFEMASKPQALIKEMKMATDANPIVNKAPRKSCSIDGYYKRPAGGFVGYQVVQNNALSGTFYAPVMMLSPYAKYSFVPVIDGMNETQRLYWCYQLQDDDSVGGSNHDYYDYEHDVLRIQYDHEVDYVPTLCVAEGDEDVFSYQMCGYKMSGDYDNPVIEEVYPAQVFAYPTFAEGLGEEGVDLLVSSKTFCGGGRHGDHYLPTTAYCGCEPYGSNEYGWWFGKNGGNSNGMPIDGIAQAFEKPTYPYVLKQVVVGTSVLVVDAPVEMTCRVYRLADGIPAYDPDTSVTLPEEPGELIAMGRATITSETCYSDDGLIFFTLYDEDDLPFNPTIDDAILIVIDGYNDEDMENLKDFSALVSSDDQSDEGYGELAYIKYGQPDEYGNFTGEYVWAGLNNFFSGGVGRLTLMTGMSIFITIDFCDGECIPIEQSYDFVVNGIYYSITQPNEVCVTFRDSRYNSYKGDIVIPNEVTYEGSNYAVTSIGENAFRGCNSLISLTIPVSVTSIADNAFRSCNLKSVCITGNGDWQAGALPSTVQTLYIGSGVTSVAGLNVNPTTIYNYSTTPSICDELTFTGYSGTLHVPAASVVAYFIADYWCNFADIIGDAVEPLSLALSQDSIELPLNGQKKLNAIINPTDATPGTVSWWSSNNAIATVENGQVRAIALGECDIVATCVGKQAVCHVTVTEIQPTSLTLSQTNATMEVGEQISLSATVLPEDATNVNVNWLSSDYGVASVNQGIVSAIAPGECDIIARCGSVSDTCHVTVVEKTIYITLDKHEVSVLPNHIVTLTPTITPEPTDLKVTNTNPSVAAVRLVNNKVQVVGIKDGETTVVVGSVDGKAVPDTCLVTVYTEVGDVNADGYVNISDVTALINYLLSGDATAVNVGKADTNKDGKINIGDVTTLINYLLSGNWPWGDIEITFIPGETTGNNATTSVADQMSLDGITISTTCGAFDAAQYRFAKNSVTTVSSSIGEITKIEFTCVAEGTNKYGPGCFQGTDGYTWEGNIGTWVGSATSVQFTAVTNQVRASKIVVTVESSSKVSPITTCDSGAFNTSILDVLCENSIGFNPL